MTDLDVRIADRLQDRGSRFTDTRRRVVSALLDAPGPVAASELAASLGTVPLSSLYRSLSVLGDAGVISLHHGPDGTTRYEPAEWLTGHHHHLVCIMCGAITDFELGDSDEVTLHRLAERVAAFHEFTADDHTLEVEGRCRECADA